MVRVRKDDGTVESFDKSKVIESIRKETGCTGKIIEEIVDEVYDTLKVLKIDPITGPLIREFVNTKFLERDMNDCRRKYTRVGMPLYDARKTDLGYGKGDNANLGDSPEVVHKRKADQLAKEQALLMFPEYISEAHLNGDIHIHDLEYITSRRFCCDVDLRFIFYYGFVGDGTGSHTSFAGPAKRPEVAILHATKTFGSSQGLFSGGQGSYNFLTFIAPYFKDCDYERIKQNIQMFIFEMTQMQTSRGGQQIFSSVQLSPSVPKMWKDKPAVYKGKVGPETYDMFERENRLLFKAFMEVMIDGDYAGKPFYFPKPEIAFEPEYIECMEYEDIHGVSGDYPSIRELYLYAFKLASKFGTPYFDNMIPPYRGAGKGICCIQCCSFSFSSGSEGDPDFDNKLYFKNGKHFTMGSSQVITLNMPRYAYESNGDIYKLIEICKYNIDIAIDACKIKEMWIQECDKNKMYSFSSQQRKDPISGDMSPPFVDFRDYVYTIGIVGINEVCEIMTGDSITNAKSHLFSLKLCNELHNYCKEQTKIHGIKLSFSRTPAETTAQRFAVLDLLNYGDAHKYVKGNVKEAIKIYAETGSRDLPIYYTNGTHVPVNANISIQDKIRIEQAFFPLLDGGNICHLFLGEAKPDPKGLMEMTLKICKSTNLGYFAFTKDFTVCNTNYVKYKGDK